MGVIDVIKKHERQEGLQKGLQQGAEQKAIGVVKNLIKELGLADEQVARIAEVPVELVRKVRTELNNEK
ncbi:hypothetical protein [Albibacterium profundi]|uniref:Transposase n=1 Tax=Albibacterium profundi TaxID=3134906 RepID=A0ABV5CGL1_9SPHI